MDRSTLARGKNDRRLDPVRVRSLGRPALLRNGPVEPQIRCFDLDQRPQLASLPRREYTIRDDYNALNAENRHTVTPNGWTHEQDNTKTLRDGERTVWTLVREFGFNDYRNIEGFDFGPAVDYWSRTQAYWAEVRNAWDQRLRSGSTLVLDTEVDGMPIIEGTFGQADEEPSKDSVARKVAIEELLSRWTHEETAANDGP